MDLNERRPFIILMAFWREVIVIEEDAEVYEPEYFLEAA